MIRRMPSWDTSSAAGDKGALRAWCYLIVLCAQRQARLRQMVWIALALLAVTGTMVAGATLAHRWTIGYWWYRVDSSGGQRAAVRKDGRGPEFKPGLPTTVILSCEQLVSALEKTAWGQAR
jgi:hypothetical protein